MPKFGAQFQICVSHGMYTVIFDNFELNASYCNTYCMYRNSVIDRLSTIPFRLETQNAKYFFCLH
jgi:hypothetical protein